MLFITIKGNSGLFVTRPCKELFNHIISVGVNNAYSCFFILFILFILIIFILELMLDI